MSINMSFSEKRRPTFEPPSEKLSTMEKLKKMFEINLEMEEPPQIDYDSTKIDFKKLLN